MIEIEYQVGFDGFELHAMAMSDVMGPIGLCSARRRYPADCVTPAQILWDCIEAIVAQAEAQAGADRIMARAVKAGYRGKYAA